MSEQSPYRQPANLDVYLSNREVVIEIVKREIEIADSYVNVNSTIEWRKLYIDYKLKLISQLIDFLKTSELSDDILKLFETKK